MNNDIYETFNTLREAINDNVIDEKDNDEQIDAFPYSSQDTLMSNVLSAAKQEFGADFNTIKNPMLYYPKDGDVTLSGVIPEMNDAKFQFRFKVGDGAGCYIWTNPYLPISDKVVQTIMKINGVCKNWRDEISKSEDYRPSNYHDNDDVQDNTQGQVSDDSSANVSINSNSENTPMMEHIINQGDDIECYYNIKHNGDDLD